MKRIIFSLMVASGLSLSAQQLSEISVIANKSVCDIQPTMWGVFFEDINFAADGGMYAELVKNRSFEFTFPLMGWSQSGQNDNGRVVPTFYSPANNNNPHYITVYVDAETGTFSLLNEGFRGMGIKQDNQYNFSLYARTQGSSDIKLKVELIDSQGALLGGNEISGFTSEWEKYNANFKAVKTEPEAQIRIIFKGKGSIDIDLVSLFPSDTWKDRPGGLRKDIVQMIADLKPGFIRFPGGCIVEGRDLTNRYQWKTTVG